MTATTHLMYTQRTEAKKDRRENAVGKRSSFPLPVACNRQTYVRTAKADTDVTSESKHPSETVRETKTTRHSRPGCANDRPPPINSKYF